MLKLEDPLDGMFKALGDGTRRAMLMRLSFGEATLGELAAPLAMSLPAVHQHLAILEEVGLVACEKRGRERWCRLNAKELARLENWIGARRVMWERRLDALSSFLQQTDSAARKKGKRK